MAFKMKGNPFQRNFPKDIKNSPTKWINFVIGAATALAKTGVKKHQPGGGDPTDDFSKIKFGNK